MPRPSREDVEKITLPRKYRAHGRLLSHFELLVTYEDLNRDYLLTLTHLDETYRAQWATERSYIKLLEYVENVRELNRKLAEAGRYAVYGKPENPPEDLSPVDEAPEGEQDGGAAK